VQGERPTVNQDLSLHGPLAYPVKKTCDIPDTLDERHRITIYLRDDVERLSSKARINGTTPDGIMKKRIVITRLSDQNYLVSVQAAWAVILICVAAHGIALVSVEPAHASWAGESMITMTDGLSGSKAQAQSPEASPSPRELLTRALEQAVATPEPFARCFLLVEIANAQCKIGDDHGMLATIDLLSEREKSHRASTLSAIAEAQASQGRFNQAMKTYELIPSSAMRSTAARRIAISQEKVGDREGAWRTVQSIELPKPKVAALLELAVMRNSIGDRVMAGKSIVQAIELVRKDPELSESAETWCDLGLTQASLGERAAAEAMFRQARRCADKKHDKTDRAYGYYFIIRDQAKSGDVAGAWEASRELSDETDVFKTRIKDKSVRAIALAFTNAGQFVEAEKAIAQIQGPSERAHAFAVLAEAEERRGDYARAKERLKVALDLVEKNSSSTSLLALAAIVNSRIALRNFDEAHTVAAMIESGTFRDDLLKNIATAECRAGDLEAALKTFQSMKNSDQKDECAQIVAAERSRKRVPGTVTWAEQLVTPSQRGYALVGIVDGLNAEPK
jgi:tetratricopeptide (TPR) repeat protein